MRVLIVKTSSMGDVVHALPAVSDIVRNHPGVVIDWMVEAPFAAIPSLHPGVRRVLPMAWRKWRKSLWTRPTQAAIAAFRAELRRDDYDLVLDLQGLLLKSVLWGLQARGPLVGYDRDSVREPLAALCYRRGAAVSRQLHAVDRNRRLASAHLGHVLSQAPPDFGILPPQGGWQASVNPEQIAVLIPCASRPEKLWPEEDWAAVGQRLRTAGLTPVVLWGSPEEGQRAQRIAAASGGQVPPLLSVGETAAVLGRARQIVGLDTGFTHLGAAFGRPAIGIYCDHEPGLAGLTGPGHVASLGGKGQVPTRAAVLAQLEFHLRVR
ncbi:MAG: lipopolysaccharide heptosyltransferase I [Ideonella sp.]|nr:lipopolysaccharide heptosyltransferase I [Ideonella sp.]